MSVAPAEPVEMESAVSPSRDRLDRWVTAAAEPVLEGFARHWLLGVNALVALYVFGAFVAPALAAAGIEGPAGALYDFYRQMCHEWAFRTFFILGPQPVVSRAQLEALGVDPFTFIGNASVGWKMAFCERDLALFLGMRGFGLLYAWRWRALGMRALSYRLYVLLCVPMAIDGFTQLFGWRESTWELRVATGLLFGVASAWLLYPRFGLTLEREPER